MTELPRINPSPFRWVLVGKTITGRDVFENRSTNQRYVLDQRIPSWRKLGPRERVNESRKSRKTA